MKNSYLTVTDQFCGAGGSSVGATSAGAELRLALNHWKLAVETHNSNFPNALHDCTDISACDPRRYPSTDILVTSPECTNHSLAKGRMRKLQRQMDLFGHVTIDPAEERSRATMWDVPRFAEFHRYNIIIVENVVEARHWVAWDAWLHAMQLLGYLWEIVYLNSMFAHPTPQSRDRMYVVFWRKGNRKPDLTITPAAHCNGCGNDVRAVQVWKRAARPWGKYKQQYIYCCPKCDGQVEPYYYCATNAIDWSLPAPRIGDRLKPLKEKTLKRIQVGLDRFGGKGMVVETAYGSNDRRQYPVDGVGPTQTGRQTLGVAVPPFLVGNYSPGWVRPITGPMGTVTAADHHGVVVPPFVVEFYGQSSAAAVDKPLGTMTGNVHHGVVTPPYLIDLRGQNAPQEITDALSTICATGNHHGVVVPFLTSYYGTGQNSEISEAMPTVPTRDRHALVVPPFIVSYYTRLSGDQAAVSSMSEATPTVPGRAVHYVAMPGKTPAIEECGFRMLQPHEIHHAMAFPDGYIVLGNQREKVKQYGNAVTPPVMKMLMERCIESLR